MTEKHGKIRVATDFNMQTTEGYVVILRHDGKELDSQMAVLGLKPGDQVILYEENEDFEVTATLGFGYTTMMGRETLYAIPDWESLVRI